MARVEMLAVGRELLIGRTVNTNAHWMGGRLAKMGSMLSAVNTVDDDLGEISRAVGEALSRSPDFLVVVGGLGPTPDDMTLKGIAAGLGSELERNEAALEQIRAHYAKRGLGGIEMTPARRKMSELPRGAEPVENPTGTAPGIRLKARGTVIFSLPGVPGEMKRMFKDSVEPEVKEVLGELHRARSTLEVRGVFESDMAPLIGAELKKHPGAYVKSHPKGIREGVSRIVLDVAVVGKSKGKSEAEVEDIVAEVTDWVRSRGGSVSPTAWVGGR